MGIKFSVAEFKALLARPDWTHAQHFDRGVTRPEQRRYWDLDLGEFVYCDIEYVRGEGVVTSTLGAFTITYQMPYRHADYDESSLVIGAGESEGQLDHDGGVIDSGKWAYKGLVVVDKNGVYEDFPIGHYASPAFSALDFTPVRKDINTAVRVGKRVALSESARRENVLAWCRVPVTYEPDLVFVGRLLGAASSFTCKDNMLGSGGRWQELALYQTKDDFYVCAKKACSTLEAEVSYLSAKVCKSIQEVTDFFDDTPIAQNLYVAAGLVNADRVWCYVDTVRGNVLVS